MSTNSFDKVFVIDDVESVEKLYKIMAAPAPPIDRSAYPEMKRSMERCEAALKERCSLLAR